MLANEYQTFINLFNSYLTFCFISLFIYLFNFLFHSIFYNCFSLIFRSYTTISFFLQQKLDVNETSFVRKKRLWSMSAISENYKWSQNILELFDIF